MAVRESRDRSLLALELPRVVYRRPGFHKEKSYGAEDTVGIVQQNFREVSNSPMKVQQGIAAQFPRQYSMKYLIYERYNVGDQITASWLCTPICTTSVPAGITNFVSKPFL